MKRRTLTTLILMILLVFIAGCDNRSRVEAMDNSEVTELPEPTPKPTPEVILVNETDEKLFFEVEFSADKEEISEEELRALDEKELINFFMGKPDWILIYPELAAEYGIRLELKPEAVGKSAYVFPKDYKLITTEENLQKYFVHLYKYADYLEFEEPGDKLYEWAIQYFGQHPELIETHPEIAKKYGITGANKEFWQEYLAMLSDTEAWEFFSGNTEMIQLMPELAEYYLGNE